jgi:AhpD family alkylhydroperoxidase
MTARLNPYAAAPHLAQQLIEFSQKMTSEGLEPAIVELVKIRASQVNGCAICLHMHATEARAKGETEARVVMLDAWRETTLYNDRERAALAWTEALTRVAETGAPDADYAAARAQFTDEEMVRLTLLIGVINTFNRIGVGFRLGPAAYARQKAA